MRILLQISLLSLLLLTQISEASAQIRSLTGKEIPISRMDSFLTAQMDPLNMPGLSIAFINDAEVVYFKGLGYADLETQKEVDSKTVFETASMSKPVFAYFVMKMVEAGIIDFDTPLYTYLAYEDVAYDERHKLFTARMVLSHTTGLPNWHDFQPPDSSLNVPEGAQYIMFTPGAKYSYSGEALPVSGRCNGSSLRNRPEGSG